MDGSVAMDGSVPAFRSDISSLDMIVRKYLALTFH